MWPSPETRSPIASRAPRCPSRRSRRSTRGRPASAPGSCAAPSRPTGRCGCRCRRSRSCACGSARRSGPARASAARRARCPGSGRDLISAFMDASLADDAELAPGLDECAIAAVSSIARVWLAHICVRMRALPIGTTGYEKPITYTPSSSSRSAMRTASAASPIITGMIGCSPGTSRKPAAAQPRAEPGARSPRAARAARPRPRAGRARRASSPRPPARCVFEKR